MDIPSNLFKLLKKLVISLVVIRDQENKESQEDNRQRKRDNKKGIETGKGRKTDYDSQTNRNRELDHLRPR